MADPLGLDSLATDEWVKRGALLRVDQKPAGDDQRDELTTQNFLRDFQRELWANRGRQSWHHHVPSRATHKDKTPRTRAQVLTTEYSFIR